MYSITLTPKRISLSEWTTIGIGGIAENFYEPQSPEETCLLLYRLKLEGQKPFILGAGSKVVIQDGSFKHPVISMRNINNLKFDGDMIYAGAGIMLPHLIKCCIERGLGGIEVLCGIPATVGGAICMNAGTRYGAIADFVDSVDFVNSDGLFSKKKNQISFGYRRGPVDGDAVVVGVWLRLTREKKSRLSERMNMILRERALTQPYEKPSAGCVFKNPSATQSAGYLIDRVGLKGFRIGGAQISTKHANFIVNIGNATFDDVKNLIEVAKKRVKQVFGIELELEIRLIY